MIIVAMIAENTMNIDRLNMKLSFANFIPPGMFNNLICSSNMTMHQIIIKFFLITSQYCSFFMIDIAP